MSIDGNLVADLERDMIWEKESSNAVERGQSLVARKTIKVFLYLCYEEAEKGCQMMGRVRGLTKCKGM